MRWGDSRRRVERFNIPAMLTTPRRDFLLRPNGDKVKVGSLRGKMTVIHFLHMRKLVKSVKARDKRGAPPIKLSPHLLDAYEEHSADGDLEVIIVAAITDDDDEEDEDEGDFDVDYKEEEDFFYQQCSRMPWLALPFSDIATRRKLTEAINPYLESYETCSVFGANGRLLSEDVEGWGMNTIDLYLPLKRIAQGKPYVPVDHGDDFLLQSLLAGPNRDFLISNQGDKVPISSLEGKVVGLYLYGSRHSYRFYPKLLSIYNQLVNRKNFEVVFVNLHFEEYGHSDENSFNKALGEMPWLALPFKDKTCKKLWYKANRVNIDDECREYGTFAVISTSGKSLDPYGAKVVNEFGTNGFPFTREKAAQIASNRVQQRQILPKIMAYHDCLIRNDQSKVHVAKIGGKNILLFVGSVDVSSTLDFLPDLIRWYEEIRRKDNKFEIVYLSQDKDVASFNVVFQRMPWLAFPFKSGQWSSHILGDVMRLPMSCCALVALGRDGRIVSTNADNHLRSRGADAYPFKVADLFEDMKREMAIRMRWSVKDKKDGREKFILPCTVCPPPKK